MTTELTPFSTLTPHFILQTLDALGLPTSGHLHALNSYENRVYQVGLDNAAPVVVKFYRPHRWTDAAILEEHAFVQQLLEQEIPVVAPTQLISGQTLYQQDKFRFAIFPRQSGRAPELMEGEAFQWMGRFIGRIHAVGALHAYQHRPTLDVDSFGIQARQFLLAEGFVATELEQVYADVSEHALTLAINCFEQAGNLSKLRLHGDCYPGNILWHDDGPHFVDFDDTRMGVAIQDLWMLISGSADEMRWQLNELLTGYEMFYEFNNNEVHVVEALRTLRLIHYSAWLARRWQDPAFPRAFPWFNTVKYWQDRILELREQIAVMQERIF